MLVRLGRGTAGQAAMMKTYYVITPEYGVVIPVLDFGIGPMEYGRDVVTVEAPTKRKALILGYHELKRIPKGWITYYRDFDQNPFVGLQVEETEAPLDEQP